MCELYGKEMNFHPLPTPPKLRYQYPLPPVLSYYAYYTLFCIHTIQHSVVIIGKFFVIILLNYVRA